MVIVLKNGTRDYSAHWCPHWIDRCFCCYVCCSPDCFLPEEDNGYFIGAISLPEGSVNIRTNAAIKEFLAYMGKDDAVEQTFGVTGFDILSGGQKPNAGLSFIKLKPWDERKGAASQVGALIGKAAAYNATHPDVNIMALNPPSIPGLGSSGGFSMYIQNKNGDSNENMQRVIGQFLGAANRRPEIKMAYTTFRMDTPSYNFDIDREKALKNGVALGDIFTALQVYYGSVQINDFTAYGRNFKVVAQADVDYRMDPSANKFLTVKDSSGNMIPISTFITPKNLMQFPLLPVIIISLRLKSVVTRQTDILPDKRWTHWKKWQRKYFLPDIVMLLWKARHRRKKPAGRRFMPWHWGCSLYSSLWRHYMKVGKFLLSYSLVCRPASSEPVLAHGCLMYIMTFISKSVC